MILCDFAVLIILGGYRQIGGYGVETDFYGPYTQQAANLLSFQPYTYTRLGPGYPLILALVSLVIKNPFYAAIFISILSSCLFSYYTYKTIGRLFTERTAFLTTILLLLNLLPYALTASTDMFAASLVAASIYFLFRSKPITRTNLVLSGLLAGYAYITRYNNLFLLIGACVTVLAMNPDRDPWRRCFTKLFIYGGGFLLIAGPWLGANYFQHGNPFYNTNYTQIASTFFGNSGDLSGAGLERMSRKFSSLGDVLSYDPKSFIYQYLKHSVAYLKDIAERIIGFPAYLFAGAGIIMLIMNMNRRRLAYIVFYFIAYLILCLVWFVQRFYLFMYPLLFLPVVYIFGSGLSKVHGAEGMPWQRTMGDYIAYTVIAIVLGASLLRQVSVYDKMISTEPRILIDVARFLKGREGNSGAGMVSRKPHVGYLSGLRRVGFPVETRMSVADFEHFATKRNAKYILYTDRDAELSPVLKVFAKPENTTTSLKVVYENRDPYLGKVYLYELDRPERKASWPNPG